MKIDFAKNNGLVPAIVQDANTSKILMLGYMNEEALAKTKAEGKVTFFSRSKGRLWTKGETSGNALLLQEIRFDCDHDTILIKATPTGPVCHTGSDTCFNEFNPIFEATKGHTLHSPFEGGQGDALNSPFKVGQKGVKKNVISNESLAFLTKLQQIIHDRKTNTIESSYTSSLLREGVSKIAQKVGEEAVELVIEAISENNARLKEEAADLLYHLLVLLELKEIRLDEVVAVLEKRHK